MTSARTAPRIPAPPRVRLLAGGRCEVWRPAGELADWARLGGAGLAAAVLGEVPADSLFVGVGRGVVRGLPTAARATVAGRSPLTGRYGEGQVGGELAARLASRFDGLVLLPSATAAPPASVLVVGARGEPSIERFEAPEDLDPEAVHARLVEAFGSGAALVVGPAGLRGGRAAVLSAVSPAGPPSRVGRGGLASLLARAGYRAIHVTADRVDTPEPSAAFRDLAAGLVRSTRLSERARSGSLELFSAREREAGGVRPSELPSDATERAGRRHGCEGCPTPCGVRLERPGGGQQPVRFGSLRGLDPTGDPDRFRSRLAELALADRFGLDAKELGAALAIEERARGERCTLERLEQRLAAAVAGDADAIPWLHGAAAVSERLGVAGEDRVLGGEATVPERDPARALARAVACGGSDPMRAFAFDGVVDPEVVRELSPWTPGIAVWWFENHAAALDAIGFCAFSAAALLGDGMRALDDLAAVWLERERTEGAGRRWIALGEEIVRARRRLDERWSGPRGLPSGSARDLDRPEVFGDYRAARGLDGDGRLAERSVAGPLARALGVAPSPTTARPAARPGAVRLLAQGALNADLAAHLGPDATFETELPLPCAELLERLAARMGSAGARLIRGGRPVPGVWRDGRRIEPNELVRDGDRLELVNVISGG